jgi:hypothetical protein
MEIPILDLFNKSNLSKFITKKNNDTLQMPLEIANMLLMGKENMYESLKGYGIYLPKLNSKCINSEYLLMVAKREVFFILEKDIKPYDREIEKWTKIDIISYLETKHFNIKSGFKYSSLPNRRWLLNVLHTFEPNHVCFTKVSSSNIQVEVPIWYFLIFIYLNNFSLLQNMNIFNNFNNSKKKVFKLKGEQKIQKKLENLARKNEKKLRRKKYLSENIYKIKSDMRDNDLFEEELRRG